MIACPTCGDPLSTSGVCGSCGFGLKSKGRPKYDPDAAHWGELAARAKDTYVSGAPTASQPWAVYPHPGYELGYPPERTDQQWYNVCKFFPWVAAHCKRPRFKVGPDHPLDATSHRGPMMRQLAPVILRRGDDPDAIAEREAIQNEGQWDTH